MSRRGAGMVVTGGCSTPDPEAAPIRHQSTFDLAMRAGELALVSYWPAAGARWAAGCAGTA